VAVSKEASVRIRIYKLGIYQNRIVEFGFGQIGTGENRLSGSGARINSIPCNCAPAIVRRAGKPVGQLRLQPVERITSSLILRIHFRNRHAAASNKESVSAFSEIPGDNLRSEWLQTGVRGRFLYWSAPCLLRNGITGDQRGR